MEESTRGLSLSEQKDQQQSTHDTKAGEMSSTPESQQEAVSAQEGSRDTTSPPFTPPQLPHLVWRRIAYFLSDSLLNLLDLASVNLVLRRICRLHISRFFAKINENEPPLSRDFLYHDLVWMILEGYLDPSSITDFLYIDQWTTKPPKTSLPGTFAQAATAKQRRKFEQLMEQTVRSSAFISPGIMSQVCEGFKEGDRDAALAIMLPLCTRLKRLDAPIVGGPLCAAVFQNIAEQYKRRGIDPKQARQKAIDAAIRDRKKPRPGPTESSGELPLSNLLILSVRAAECGLGPELAESIPFMGIPSLQRVILESVRDREFPGWPSEMPRPSAPEIYFQQSSCFKDAVRAFAEGLHGPCEIRQWFEQPIECWDGGTDFPRSASWDRVLVDENGKVEIRLDFSGGNPGCEHAWASWLCFGKMLDWQRIDEEFAPDDLDEEHPELTGVLARF